MPSDLENPLQIWDGRRAGTGHLSILPVDQGIKHSGGSTFGPTPDYLDAESIGRLAVEGGCKAVASTLGVLGSVSRRWAHKIPFIVKLNHNELLTYPNSFELALFAQVEQAGDLGAAAVGATVCFGQIAMHRCRLDLILSDSAEKSFSPRSSAP